MNKKTPQKYRRLVLYYEQLPTIDGRVLMHTTWPKVVPLKVRRRGDWRVVGNVRNMRRTAVIGRVAVVGLASVDLTRYTGLAAEPDFDLAEFDHTGDMLIATEARLMDVCLGEHPCWDMMTIGDHRLVLRPGKKQSASCA